MAKSNAKYKKKNEINVLHPEADKSFNLKERNDVKKKNVYQKQSLQNPELIIKNLR